MLLRVLIVEDSEDDALLVLRELRRGGHEPRWERVQTAADMEAALEGGEWDLVISDHSMPSFSSSAALEILRGRGLDLPFIIVSGRIGEDVAVAAMRSGAHDYIMKDNMARLNTAVERELREAEGRRERRRAEEKYRSIFENSVEGIFQTDASGALVIANPAFARMLGYGDPAEVIPAVSVLGEDLYADPGRREELYRTVQERGEVSGFEVEVYRRDGERIWLSLTARAVCEGSGSVAGYEGTAEDITDRKSGEEALRTFRETERRRIARDLHDEALQDLTYVLQSMQLARLLHPDPDEERERQIEALRRSVGGLREAIYDLRLDAVRDRSFLAALESLVALNRTMAPERPVEVEVEEGFPEVLPGETGVEALRVVKEALTNARRHSGARGVRVRLSRRRGELWVEVEDDGRGFEAGTSGGVGLTGMEERAALIGAVLEIRSARGQGTRVRLRVPEGDL